MTFLGSKIFHFWHNSTFKQTWWQTKVLNLIGHQETPPLLQPIPGVSWELKIASCPISLDHQPAIIDHLSCQCALDYWISKTQLTVASSLLIDWPLLGLALQSWPPTYCMWVWKFVSRHSMVSQTMARWKKWDSPLCPFCHMMEETTLHIL